MLHHEVRPGAEPTLVLLHAFPLSSWMWHRLLPLLGHRVVRVDLPGLGRSAVPDQEPSMDVVADLVLEALSAGGTTTFVPYGVSTGGYVALELAARAPERVGGLVLGGTTHRLVTPDDPGERRRTATEVLAAASTSPVADSAHEGLGATARRRQPWLEEELSDLVAAGDPAGVAWMARAIASRRDRADVLAAFAGPVHLLFGEEDEPTPLARAEEMRSVRRAVGRHCELEVLAGTGHLAPLEQPERVAAVLNRAWPTA